MTGVILLMAEPRTSHRLTTGRISRSCVFLTTPRARGTAATYNQHIFMSRGQTPLYWMANHTLSPSTLHTACPSSFSLLSFFILFFFLLRSGSEMEEEGGGQREREMNGRNYSTTLGATSRARALPSLAICQSRGPPILPTRIFRSHFTIFRSEINAAPSAHRPCLSLSTVSLWHQAPSPSPRTTQKTHEIDASFDARVRGRSMYVDDRRIISFLCTWVRNWNLGSKNYYYFFFFLDK